MRAANSRVSLSLTFAGIAAFTIWVLLFGLDQRTTSDQYGSFAEALAEDDFVDGWMPEFVPKTARDIRVRRGVDPSFIELEFTYSEADREEIVGGFSEVTEAGLSASMIRGSQRLPWSRALPASVRVFKREPRTQRSRPSEFTLFLDDSEGRAWYLAR